MFNKIQPFNYAPFPLLTGDKIRHAKVKIRGEKYFFVIQGWYVGTAHNSGMEPPTPISGMKDIYINYRF